MTPWQYWRGGIVLGSVFLLAHGAVTFLAVKWALK